MSHRNRNEEFTKPWDNARVVAPDATTAGISKGDLVGFIAKVIKAIVTDHPSLRNHLDLGSGAAFTSSTMGKTPQRNRNFGAGSPGEATIGQLLGCEKANENSRPAGFGPAGGDEEEELDVAKVAKAIRARFIAAKASCARNHRGMNKGTPDCLYCRGKGFEWGFGLETYGANLPPGSHNVTS